MKSVMLKKKVVCFVDLEKALDRFSRKVLEWALRKKGIPDVLVRSVMNVHEGSKTSARVDSKLSVEFEVKNVDAPRICAVTFSF